MPLPVPSLDDRNFDQLAKEARSLIPKYFHAWTDNNPSDPGITLLELFAFLVEAAIYQIDRVPERSLEHFAALVGVGRQPGSTIGDTLRQALATIATNSRAVLEPELETLAKENIQNVARVLASVEVVDTPNIAPAEQLINVIVLPTGPDSASCDDAPTPTDALREQVFENLASRRLITSRIHVASPTYTPVTIDTTVVRSISGYGGRDMVASGVSKGIDSFLSALSGGLSGQGWAPGHPLYRSELYRRIQAVSGVDHVRELLLNGDETADEVRPGSATSFFCLKATGLKVTVVDE